MNIALVNMPFIRIEQPSHALGLLKSYLTKSGISSDCLYLTIDLSQKIGLDSYNTIDFGFTCGIASNWCFSKILSSDPRNSIIDENLSVYFAEFNMDASYMVDMRQLCEEFIEEQVNDNKWDKYDIIGFTTSGPQCIASLAMGKKLKEKYPYKTIVYGGPSMYDEAAVEYMTQFDWIDYIFVGEADISFPQFAECIRDNKNINHIEGLARREGDNIVYLDHTDVLDINKSPLPDYTDFFNQVKSATNSDQLSKEYIGMSLEFSRGCYYGNKKCCTFCADVELARRQYKPRSASNAVSFLKQACEKYPFAKKFWLADPIMPPGYVKNILKPWSQIKPSSIELFLETKPWFDRNDAKIMAEAGVSHVQMGIETLHPKTNDLLRKGDTTLRSIACLKWMELYGVHVAWNYLWRVPGEEVSWYDEIPSLLQKLRHLSPPIAFAPVFVTKKSPYWAERDQFKFKNLAPLYLYKNIYPPNVDLEKVAWYFEYEDQYTRHSSKGKNSMSFNLPDQHKAVHYEIKEWTDAKKSQSIILELEGNIVRDSRQHFLKEYLLNDLERDILVMCDYPQVLRKIETQFGECKQELDKLIDLGLIISQENRYLSVVLIPDCEMKQEVSNSLTIELPVFASAL